jgi:hypothetical protein
MLTPRQSPALLCLLMAWLALPPLGRAAAPATDPFAVAGISRAEAVEFLARLQQAVATGDAAAVASLTRFPLTVNGRSGAANATEFVSRYEVIYNERVRTAILNQTVAGMFVNWKGLIVGHGEVWIAASCDADGPPGECRNRRILVSSINNDFPATP